MKFSFIVTSYNIEDFIGPCLDSLAPCLRAGDQLIIVDDGSTDCSCEEIYAKLEAFTGKGIEVCPIFLGANTIGGVGIPANIALKEVQGEAIFFVDGDDVVDGHGFLEARHSYEARPCDILIANYRVYDFTNERYSSPADYPLWRKVSAASDPEQKRQLALRMIGVPWRKIYGTSFVLSNDLSFPEGDFFYEDNPFHWQVCLAASDIRFFDRSVCTHRVARSGQTMAANGTELVAFFKHYRTILGYLKHERYRPDALRWLLENMAWHLERLDPRAHWIYAMHAREVLAQVPERDWRALQQDPVALRSWGVARELAAGNLASVISGWQGLAVMRKLSDIERRFAVVTDELEKQTEAVDELRVWADGQKALLEFNALKALTK